jgi:hypothetical protein
MRCPECRKKLSVRWRGLPFFLCVVLAAIIAGVFFLVSGWTHLPADTAIRFGILLVAWFLLELATAVFIFTFATFVSRS